MTKLEPEFKKKWIEALRSGEFKQTKGMLHSSREDSYCCLGVAGSLCDIPTYLMCNNESILSANAFSGYEIPAFLKRQHNDSCQKLLAEMNDGGKSFNEIADYIEENL